MKDIFKILIGVGIIFTVVLYLIQSHAENKAKAIYLPINWVETE